MLDQFLVFSDVHLHPWIYGSTVTEEGYNSRLVMQYYSIKEMINYAIENNIKHIFFTGDLFHTHGHVHAQALSLAVAAFTEMYNHGIVAHVIPGNHDMANKKGTIHSLTWLRPICHLVEKEEFFEVDGVQVGMLPYVEDEVKLKSFLDKAQDCRFVFMHQGVAGQAMSSGFVPNEVLTPEMIPDNVLAFVGHYHKPHIDYNIVIPGSMMQHTRADDDGMERGFLHLEQSGEKSKRVFLNISPKFKSVNYNTFSESSKAFPINNSFVKVFNYYGIDIKELREFLFKHGALAVEFDVEKHRPNNGLGILNVNQDIKPRDFTIEPLLKEYDKLQTSNRRGEIGKLLREGLYETPEF